MGLWNCSNSKCLSESCRTGSLACGGIVSPLTRPILLHPPSCTAYEAAHHQPKRKRKGAPSAVDDTWARRVRNPSPWGLRRQASCSADSLHLQSRTWGRGVAFIFGMVVASHSLKLRTMMSLRLWKFSYLLLSSSNVEQRRVRERVDPSSDPIGYFFGRKRNKDVRDNGHIFQGRHTRVIPLHTLLHGKLSVRWYFEGG